MFPFFQGSSSCWGLNRNAAPFCYSAGATSKGSKVSHNKGDHEFVSIFSFWSFIGVKETIR